MLESCGPVTVELSQGRQTIDRIGYMQDEDTIRVAKAGDMHSLGRLLSSYEGYLLVLAEAQLGKSIRSKVDAADVVQDTFLEAHRSFSRFRGTTHEQLVAWLKSILAARLTNTIRRYLGTQARDIRLEQQIDRSLDESALSLGGMLAAPGSSPSQHASRHEQAKLVAEAIQRLPADYRQVIILRHLEGMTFPEVSKQMQRSLGSVEKLWLRGMSKLKQEFDLGDQSAHQPTRGD